MEIANQHNKIQNFQWYLLGSSLLFCVISIIFFERIPVGGGLGWDGSNYYEITKNFKHKIFEGNIDIYYLKRSFPSGIVYAFFKIIKEFCHLVGLMPLDVTPSRVIFCFSILNTIGIVGGNYFLFKIYDKFAFEKKLQILCFLLFNLTFITAKWTFYYPVLTDHLALFMSVAMFYAYLFSKNYLLLALFFVGYFTFPTLSVMASILFIFPYKKEPNQIKIDKKHLLTISIIGLVAVVGMFVYNAYPIIVALLNKLPLGAPSETPNNYPFFMVSVGFVFFIRNSNYVSI